MGARWFARIKAGPAPGHNLPRRPRKPSEAPDSVPSRTKLNNPGLDVEG
jgi:hypothetical protein